MLVFSYATFLFEKKFLNCIQDNANWAYIKSSSPFNLIGPKYLCHVWLNKKNKYNALKLPMCILNIQTRSIIWKIMIASDEWSHHHKSLLGHKISKIWKWILIVRWITNLNLLGWFLMRLYKSWKQRRKDYKNFSFFLRLIAKK
jgi:hypothetical protein